MAQAQTTSDRGLPHRIGFFLVPRFSMMAFSSAVEPLRAANLLSGRNLYRWQVFSRDGGPVQASNGMVLQTEPAFAEATRVETLFLCASYDPEATMDRQTLAWLRRMPVAGTRLGAVDTGAWFLAHAGLLDGHRATVHWEWRDAFAEKFPQVDTRLSLFEIDRGRITCAGATAALDMMLHLIGLEFGPKLAVDISEQFIHERIRPPDDMQRMALGKRLGVTDPTMEAVIRAMENSLEEPLRAPALARIAGTSERQLERLFRRALGVTPVQYYLDLRLRRARVLLTQTRLPVMEVAMACGFASAGHFARAYRGRFGMSPRVDRRRS